MAEHNPWKTAGVSNILTPGVAVGDVFYVDGVGGSDSALNPGIDPMAPLLSITRALALCTDDENDTVVVLNYPENTAVAGEAEPIVVNKNRVHILGAAYPYVRGDKKAYIGAQGANPIFQVTARWVEIAYFKLGGGAGEGCIQLANTFESKGLSIHHCIFATKYGPGGAPAYGIDASDSNHGNWMYIGDNVFSNPITSHAIYIQNAAGFCIERNRFICPGGLGIFCEGPSGHGEIIDNYFGIATVNVALVGAAITLIGSTQGVLVAGNMANSGMPNMGVNPYRDSGTGATNQNSWMGNMLGSGFTAPA